MGQVLNLVLKLTENTMRKNGRKSSNISVKKYHHRPGFGVRSGNRMLAPHVLVVQLRPPATTLDARVRTAK